MIIKLSFGLKILKGADRMKKYDILEKKLTSVMMLLLYQSIVVDADSIYNLVKEMTEEER